YIESNILLENNEIEEIISKLPDVQAKKNKEPIGEDEDEDGEPNPPVSAAKVCNAMQTVIHYKEQENA
ncbi:6024_t:CDS:1, partial [Racocetra fulgida]